jgi:dsRNA-specific ribonuclease
MLAWLGDAALHGGLTAALLAAYPTSPLGELTNARSILVSRASLAVLGRQLDLGSALLVGSSFAAAASGAGGATKNMVAEAAEAVLGAVAVDAGPDAAVAAYWRVAGPLPERLEDVMAAAMAARAAE